MPAPWKTPDRRTAALATAAALLAALTASAVPAAAQEAPPVIVLGTLAGAEGVGPGTSVAQAPSDVALDGDRLLVADGLYGVVRALDLTSGVETVLGRLPAPHAAARLERGSEAVEVNPMALVPDGAGGVLVLETRRSRLLRLSAAGTWTVLAGSDDPGYDGDGGPATEAHLSSPRGLARAADGSVLIADTGNHVVRRIDRAGTITTVAGQGRTAGFAGDGGPARAARLARPRDVAVDASGRVLVADSGNTRIRRIDAAGTITTIAGSATPPPGSEDRRCPRPGEPALSWIEDPTSLTVDRGGAVLATTGYCVVRLSGGTLTPIAGTGDHSPSKEPQPATRTALDAPSGIAVAPDGSVLLAEGRQGQVRRVTPAGAISTVAGVLSVRFGSPHPRFDSGDLRPASSSQLPDMTALVTGPDGRLTFTDSVNGTIRSVAPDSTLAPLSALAGQAASVSPGPGQLLSASHFTRTAVAYDAEQRLVVADTSQGRVYRVGADGRLVLLAGSGSPCRTPTDGDGGPAVDAELFGPTVVATAPDGDVLVAEEFSGRIRRITPAGTISTVSGAYTHVCTGPGSFRNPLGGSITGLAVAADGTLWATTPGCLNVLRPGSAWQRCVDSLWGGPDLPGAGIAVRPDGSVVYSDPGRSQVRTMAPDGTVRVLAGSGRPGCAADGEPAATAALGLPSVLTLTADGTVAVYDAGCHAVRTLGPAGDRVSETRPVTRLSGPDRLVTGVEIARHTYRDGTAKAAVLARADSFADALAGAPLAAHVDGPLLLTGRDRLSGWTESQLREALPRGATVHVLGGTGALSSAVDARLRALGWTVVRYAGDDRYSTATAIAERGIGGGSAVFLTTGTSFPDALSASAAAASTGGVVVLTAGAAVPAATAAYLATRPAATTYAVGGPAALAAPDAVALAGDDRYATSAAVARRFFPAPGAVAVAGGAGFADALTGAAAAATHDAPLLLTPANRLAAPAQDYLAAATQGGTRAYVYGGTSAVGPAVTTTLRSVLGTP